MCTLELCVSNLFIYGLIIRSDFTSIETSIFDQRIICPIRSYLLFSGFSLLYTSYCLQAYYRLRQVIFYKKRDSYKTFVKLCVIQWIFAFLLVLPILLTRSFVYLPTEFFCPIPFNKPIAVTYIAVSVYGVFLTIFATIYLWIYVYASRVSAVTVHRRRIIDRQFKMLKRITLPTFSLMFLGIVYLVLFFQAIVNEFETHFLTYRLSYLFIAIGMSFIHIITIIQTPSIKKGVAELFYCHKGHTTNGAGNSYTSTNNPMTASQQWTKREERMVCVARQVNQVELIEEREKMELIKINPSVEPACLGKIDATIS